MKVSFTKLKNSTQGIVFFWRALIISFFVGLLIILLASLLFWFNLNQDINSQVASSPTQVKNTIDAKRINLVLGQIKDRADEATSTATNLPVIVDPSL